ncbi:MAG TPA: zinc-binding dehydrogenase [Polyangiaceae bacterium]|nr:zinc-binding dehydrogenase [Polyangiaceae bacterium]
MRYRELWFMGPHAVELREASGPAPLAPGQVRLRALASGISQGTELLLYRGEGPTPFDPSLDASGAPTYPRRYGYAWVGQVVESNSPLLSVGVRAFALAAHGDEHCLDAARARRLPEDVPTERAVLAANLETAVNVVWDGGIGLGDDVVVLGGGVVGLLSGLLARLGGARRVRLVEPSEARRRLAHELGFDAALGLEQSLQSADADVVIEASGNPASLDQAIACARQEGLVVVASFYGQRVAPVSFGAEFHRRRLSLRASQVSTIPAERAAGWSLARRFELVSELLGDARLDALLEPALSFDEAPAAYARLAATPGEARQVIFRY